MIAPWWLLGVIAMIGAVPIWWLVEMEGFSKTSSDDGDSEDDEDEFDDDVDEEENRLLSFSEEILEGDEILPYDADEEDLSRHTISGPSLNKRIEKEEEEGGGGEGQRRRRSATLTNIERRMSSPIGIRGGSVGPGGGRKLSNGLAASNVGIGTGGTSFA